MDIQKEKEAFLNVYVNYKGGSRKIQFNEETEQFMWRKNNVSDTEVEYVHLMNQRWYAWLACAKSKAQAVPKWISAQDKLPEFQQEVLILVGDEYLVAQYLPSETNEFGIQFKEGFWINGGTSVVDTDLWISLPQPPKAQEQSHV